VFRPDVASRMEQANDFAAIRINAGNVRTLKPIAMDASKGKIITGGGSAVLSSNNVIYLERRRVEFRRQLAILTACSCSLPNLADEICVQFARLLSRTLQGASPLGLHDSEKVPDVDVAVEFGLIFAGEVTLTSQIGQLVHASRVAIAEANRQQVFSRTARQFLLLDLDEPGQDRRFSIGASRMRAHLVSPTQLCHDTATMSSGRLGG